MIYVTGNRQFFFLFINHLCVCARARVFCTYVWSIHAVSHAFAMYYRELFT